MARNLHFIVYRIPVASVRALTRRMYTREDRKIVLKNPDGRALVECWSDFLLLLFSSYIPIAYTRMSI